MLTIANDDAFRVADAAFRDGEFLATAQVKLLLARYKAALEGLAYVGSAAAYKMIHVDLTSKVYELEGYLVARGCYDAPALRAVA